jgi:hypothetical protein
MSKKVAANEDDTGIRRSRTKLNRNVVSCPKTESCKANVFGDGVLIPKGFTDFLTGKQ